ncbi:MAG: hypothetical protein AAGF67_03970 [Verrucomicrobiota bacterium]
MSSLQTTLDEIHEKFESSVTDKSILEIMHRATDDLVASDHPLDAVREGSTMPDFTLDDSAGNSVSSSQLLDKGPLIVSFFRGFW